MKLLFVTDNGFYKNGDDYFYSAPNLAHTNNLSKFFNEFVVVAREDNIEPSYTKCPQNINVHLVKKTNILCLIKTLNNLIKDCDAVMCYGTNGTFASFVGKKHKKVVCAYSGGDPYDFCMVRGNLKGRILAPIAREMEKMSFKNADFGHYCDDFLFDKYPAKNMLACSGVDIVCDENVLEKRLQKNCKFSKENKIKLGLIGHTKNSLKGIDIAIEAVSKLPNNYYLEVVGRGDTENYYQQAEKLGCRERVSFLGAKKAGDELFTWLDAVDIYLQPSRIEGLPRATIEAMSRALVCVTSNVGALGKLTPKNLIIDNNNANEYADVILKISDSNILSEIGEQNFNKVKKYEKVERDRKYDEFYSMVIKEIERRKND